MKLSLVAILLLTALELHCLVPTWYRIVKYKSKNIMKKCKYCKPHYIRNKRDRELFASVAWTSPLEGHGMKIVCPMQDEHLLRRDLSSLLWPEWITTHQDPVGRCPVIYRQIIDPNRLWPRVLLAAECACERSRCTVRGSHLCITVYMAITVHLREEGMKKQLISVDCVCAAQRSRLVTISKPKIVI
ncbi:uncharacterized protein [Rhodnius prolixus]|uniref:uncharacterized protein n=1 Tax=Rhodnius prolixus TaxID=13249 RepID=UPI003D18CAA1